MDLKTVKRRAKAELELARDQIADWDEDVAGLLAQVEAALLQGGAGDE
jgi:hypothetical protein